MKKLIVLSCLLTLLGSCKETTENAAKPSIEKPNIEEVKDVDSESKSYDKMLNDYNEYVNQYMSLYKKAIQGDSSALTEYPKMMEKATEIEQSLKSIQNNNDLNALQIKRLSEIQSKMLKAMQ